MQIKLISIGIIIISLLTSCVSYDFSKKVIQQGNLLPESKINRLKIGMSKEAVSQTLGTSLITPLFDNNHWDYAFTTRHANDPLIVRHVELDFKNNRLIKISKS